MLYLKSKIEYVDEKPAFFKLSKSSSLVKKYLFLEYALCPDTEDALKRLNRKGNGMKLLKHINIKKTI